MSDELKEMFEELRDFDWLSTYQSFVDEIREKVEEEIALENQKIGHWNTKYIEDGYVECSECGSLTNCIVEYDLETLHYCPNCGAKMGGE